MKIKINQNNISKLIVLSLLIMIIYSCNKWNENPKKELKISSKLGYELFEDSIAATEKNGTKLCYKFNTDSTGYILKSIVIYANSIKSQDIDVNMNIEKKEFKLIDCNFDGYKDIQVLLNCGSGGCSYALWNYSPKDGKYIYNKELSEYIGLNIDTISRKIIFHYRGGEDNEVIDTLEYVEGKLTPVN
jgi:hypothetical protein